MKKLLFILLITHCLTCPPFGGLLIAQTPIQQWAQRFSNGNFASGYSVKLDSSGYVYVLVGNSFADSTNGDYCILKYSSSGTLI